MTALYYESSIAHHGIKGQRWGFRRFQNPDGTLTAAGRKRQQKQMEKISRKENKVQRKIAKENLKVQEKLKTAEAAAKLQEDKDRLAELTSKKPKSSPAPSSSNVSRKNISNLSDAELAALISRVQLEQRYSSLVTPPKVETNKDKATHYLKDLGTYYMKDLGTQLNKAITTTMVNAANHKNEMEKMNKEAEKNKAAIEREDYKWRREAARENLKWKRDAEREDLKWTRDAQKAIDMENLKWENQQKTANNTWARKHYDDFMKSQSSKSYSESTSDYSDIVDVDDNYINPYANRNMNSLMVIDPWGRRR